MTAYELRHHLADAHDITLRGVAYQHMVTEHRHLHCSGTVDHDHDEEDDR